MIRSTAGDPPAPRITVEYVGFRSTETRREYRLVTHAGTATREYVVGITHDCFVSGKARLQDGPEISYEKIRRELAANGEQPEATDFTITLDELASFKALHAPPPRGYSKKAVVPKVVAEEEASRAVEHGAPHVDASRTDPHA